MERLLAALGNPERGLRCLHVAGTNGKGSVCAFAESMLRASGHRVGLYTSPHLVEFSERIRIDGVNASAAEIAIGINRLREVTAGWSEAEQPTFFELVTALAFELFARAGCEVVVLETGLGGRLDATNLAPKVACAITPIGLDHTEWLGDTLGKIAREKAGILRPGVPVVIAPQEAEASEVLCSVAAGLGTPLQWINEPLPRTTLLGLAGSHQRHNAALALGLVRAAGFELSEEAVASGLASVAWPGRFQRLRGGKLILDGAHNVHAARQLVATWREEFGGQRCRLIFGALADKNPEALLAELAPLAEEILLVPVASARGGDPKDLAELSVSLGVPIHLFESLGEAMAFAESCDATPQAPVLLAGSLFLVGEALALVSGTGVALRSQ
jgi:dihydrofolate synthase/folylpolyglutamate synthase